MIYACPACEFAADTSLLKLQRLQNKFSVPLGPHRPANWMWLSKFHVYMTLLQIYAGSRQKSPKITKM
jgi:hypothetical protein